MTLGQRRGDLGYTLAEASKLSHVSKSAIHSIETGQRRPNDVTVTLLAPVYEMTVDEFCAAIPAAPVRSDRRVLVGCATHAQVELLARHLGKHRGQIIDEAVAHFSSVALSRIASARAGGVS